MKRYKAQNAFGTQVEVTDTETEWWRVIILNDFNHSFSMEADPATARRLKENLKLLIIGLLSEPHVMEASNKETPTIANPHIASATEHWIVMKAQEIWLYDSSTGKIFEKRKVG